MLLFKYINVTLQNVPSLYFCKSEIHLILFLLYILLSGITSNDDNYFHAYHSFFHILDSFFRNIPRSEIIESKGTNVIISPEILLKCFFKKSCQFIMNSRAHFFLNHTSDQHGPFMWFQNCVTNVSYVFFDKMDIL